MSKHPILGCHPGVSSRGLMMTAEKGNTMTDNELNTMVEEILEDATDMTQYENIMIKDGQHLIMGLEKYSILLEDEHEVDLINDEGTTVSILADNITIRKYTTLAIITIEGDFAMSRNTNLEPLRR